MLSRKNLSYPSRHSTPNSRPFNRLQPLCSLLPAPVLCFQSFAASFPKTPGVGVLSIRRRRQILERPSGIKGSQPPNSFVSYHILVNPVLSCNYALFAQWQANKSNTLSHLRTLSIATGVVPLAPSEVAKGHSTVLQSAPLLSPWASPTPTRLGRLREEHFRLDFVRQKKYCSTAKSPVRPQLPSLEVCP